MEEEGHIPREIVSLARNRSISPSRKIDFVEIVNLFVSAEVEITISFPCGGG